jgi:glycosyltransferase involved in cell wall biosynthesis
MRILFVIDNLGSGGAQRQMVELAIGFHGKGLNVSFLVYHNLPFYQSILDTNDIPITYIQEPNHIRRLLKMRMFIRNGKYNAVISFLEAPNFICEIAGFPYRKWKLIVGERSANPRILKSFKLKSYRWFHIFADFVVANSEANLKIVRTVNPLLKESKCKVIYNLLDSNIWKPSSDYIPLRNGKFKLLVIASHQYVKNLNGLIDALSLLDKDEKSRITIEWYGDRILGPFINNSFPEAMEKLALLNLQNVITFYPPTNDIIGKILKADAVGLFSFYEGLPNVVCEGMACAKPVVCSNISDVSKFLSYDANLLCDPADPHSIKNSLSYLINLSEDRILEIGQENKRISEKLFDKEKIVSDYLSLLKPGE